MRLLLCPLFLLVTCSLIVKAEEPSQSSLNLLPWPKSVQMGSGEMRFGEKSRILIANPELKPLAEIFREELRLVTGLNLQISAEAPSAGDLWLSLNKEILAGEEILSVSQGVVRRSKEGAHRLTVTDRVKIEGYDYRAVAEGTATLLQALATTEKGTVVSSLTINDWPHADYTGAMLDVARQANTIEEIRRCVLVCRAFKVRYLQLHLTDDQAWTFPSTAYPKLGTLNGSAHGGPVPPRYDLAELKALAKDAQQRGVTLVPELETPGHSGNAVGTLPDVFGYIDPATKQPVHQGMMNIANPKLYEALDTIIGEMCEVFASSPYFHIGIDEVSGLGNVAATEQAQNFVKEKKLQNAGELMGYFTREVNEMVKKRGRKTIIWEGAANGAAKDIVHMTWDGGARTAERLVAEGITTITVPWNLAGVPWNEWSMYHSNGSVLKPGDPVLGAMLPAWEQKGEVNLRWLRGGLPWRQDRTWGPKTVLEPKNFNRRMAATNKVLDRLLYGFAISHEPNSDDGLAGRQITAPTKLALHAWPTLGAVHFTTDGSEPTAKSPPFPESFAVADNFTLKARLFDANGKAVAATWTQPYTFAPLTLKASGLLPDSIWFSDSATASISSVMQNGTVRYTLDGSPPVAASPAYASPLQLTKTTTLKAQWFDEQNVGRGDVVGATYQKIETAQHAALHKPITITVTANLQDPAAAGKLLVDGVLARGGNWGSPEVLPLSSSNLEAVIDMGATTEIHQVIARCLYCQEAGIYPARKVEVFVSEDGKSYTAAGHAEFKVPDARGADGSSVRAIPVELKSRARYLKVICTNNGQLPAWHNSPGVPGHLMLDEILVNPEPAKP